MIHNSAECVNQICICSNENQDLLCICETVTDENNNARTLVVEKVKTHQRTAKKQQKLFHTGKDHVFNIILCFKLTIPIIFTNVHVVKTGLFNKSNSVSFIHV